MTTVSILIATRDRPEVLRKCVMSCLDQSKEISEIIIVDDAPKNFSAENLVSELSHITNIPFSYSRVENSVGVSGTRNILILKNTADIMVFIDDDAYLDDIDSIAKGVLRFEVDMTLGALATRVTNVTSSGESLLLPLSKLDLLRKPMRPGERRLVSTYIGAYHFLRASSITNIGLYKDDMIYGSEELDMSYRLIDNGYNIEYDDTVTAYHVPQPSVVSNSKNSHRISSEQFYNIRNRYYIAQRYLPEQYGLIYRAIWTLFYAKSLKMNQISEYFTAVVPNAIRYSKNVKKLKLKKSTIEYLKRNYGRLFY